MKTLVAILSLLTFMTAHADEIVSAKALAGIESRIEMQREMLKEKLSNFETDDITEGKIVAAMVNTIEAELAQAEEGLKSITSDDQLTDENIDAINKILDESESLIKEI